MASERALVLPHVLGIETIQGCFTGFAYTHTHQTAAVYTVLSK